MFDIIEDARDPETEAVSPILVALTIAKRLGQHIEWCIERHGDKFLAMVAEDTDHLIAGSQLRGGSLASPALAELQAALRVAHELVADESMRNLVIFTAHHAAQTRLHEEIAAAKGVILQPHERMPPHRAYLFATYARCDFRRAATLATTTPEAETSAKTTPRKGS